jgi:hypothetical protein
MHMVDCNGLNETHPAYTHQIRFPVKKLCRGIYNEIGELKYTDHDPHMLSPRPAHCHGKKAKVQGTRTGDRPSVSRLCGVSRMGVFPVAWVFQLLLGFEEHILDIFGNPAGGKKENQKAICGPP